MKHYRTEEIIHKLREPAISFAPGNSTSQISKKLGIVEQTYQR